MKDGLLIALVLLCGFCVYKVCERNDARNAAAEVAQATPAPPPVPPTPRPIIRHLAPDGSFYLVDYVSARTPKGVMGFVPGQMVHFVSANEANSTLTVSDGKCDVEVQPWQLTNDIDVANMARRQDQESQRQLQVAQEAARKVDEQARQQIDLEHSKHVAQVHTGSAVGGVTKLDEGSQAASSYDRAYQKYGGYPYDNNAYSGSPYYYLHRRTYTPYSPYGY